MNSSILPHLAEQLRQYPAHRYLVGFSGGRDSHVLLDALCRLTRDGSLTAPVVAIHVNHNFSAQSDDWVEHCRARCAEYGVPFIGEAISESIPAGVSLEAFAREQRYRLIQKHMVEGDVFLSAHHQRDQAETCLLQLLRGAGLEGLKSMPVKKSFGAGSYVRPLLYVPFEGVVEYADECNLSFIIDESNADTRFDRNFVRHEVLPILSQRFSQAEKNIAQSARWLSEISAEAAPQELKVSDLRVLPYAQQKHTVRSYLKEKIGRAVSQAQVDYIINHHVHASKDKHPELVIDGCVVRRHGDEIVVTQSLPDWCIDSLIVCVDKDIVLHDGIVLGWERGQGIAIDTELTLAPLSGGDRFHPHYRGCATTVKKALHEAGVPRWLRRYYCGLYADNEIVAIPGVAVDKAFYQQNAKAALPLWQIDQLFVRM